MPNSISKMRFEDAVLLQLLQHTVESTTSCRTSMEAQFEFQKCGWPGNAEEWSRAGMARKIADGKVEGTGKREGQELAIWVKGMSDK